MTRSLMKFFVILTALFAMPQAAMAQAFSCAVYGGTPYCQYTGKVKQAYINETNLIILDFEENVDPAVISSSGYSGTPYTSAAAYNASANSAFGEYLYTTMLTALAGDKNVIIQMRGTVEGYMKIDRIWIVK